MRVLLLFLCTAATFSIYAQDIHQHYDFGQEAKLLASTPLPGGLLVGVGELVDSTNTQGWVTLFSSSGEVLWTMVTSDTEHQCRFQQVVAGTDSVFYIGGTLYVDSIRGYDLLMTKMNIDGQIEWSKIVNGNFQDELTGLAIFTVWNDPFVQAIVAVGSTIIDSTNTDILVARINNEGALPHSKILGGPGIDQPYHLVNKSRNGYISGTTNHDGVSSVPLSGLLFKVDLDVIIIDYDWRFEGWTGNVTPEALALNQYDEPLIALHEDSAPTEHIIYSFITPSGIKWVGSYSSNKIKAIQQTASGITSAITDNEIINLDENGKVIEAWKFKNNPTFRCTDLNIRPEGDYLISGFSSSQGYRPTFDFIQDPAQLNCDITNTSIIRQNYGLQKKGVNMGPTGKGIIDAFDLNLSTIDIDRVIECQSTTPIISPTIPVRILSHPNPTTGIVNIKLPYPSQGKLSWYRGDGALVSTNEYKYSVSEINEDISTFLPGTYILEFRDGVNQGWRSTVILTK